MLELDKISSQSYINDVISVPIVTKEISSLAIPRKLSLRYSGYSSKGSWGGGLYSPPSCFDGKRIWSAKYDLVDGLPDSYMIVRGIDIISGEVILIPLASEYQAPTGLCSDGTYLWVLCGNSINRIDLITFAVERRVFSDLGFESVAMTHAAFDGNYLWVSGYEGLIRLDREALTILNSWTFDTIDYASSNGGNICFDGKYIFRAGIYSGWLTKVDTASCAAVTYALTLGGGNGGVACTFDGRHVWIHYVNGSLIKWNPRANSWLLSIDIGQAYYRGCFSGKYVYLYTPYNNSIIARVDVDRNSSTTITVGVYSSIVPINGGVALVDETYQRVSIFSE